MALAGPIPEACDVTVMACITSEILSAPFIKPPKWSLPVSHDYCICTCMAYSYHTVRGFLAVCSVCVEHFVLSDETLPLLTSVVDDNTTTQINLGDPDRAPHMCIVRLAVNRLQLLLFVFLRHVLIRNQALNDRTMMNSLPHLLDQWTMARTLYWLERYIGPTAWQQRLICRCHLLIPFVPDSVFNGYCDWHTAYGII